MSPTTMATSEPGTRLHQIVIECLQKPGMVKESRYTDGNEQDQDANVKVKETSTGPSTTEEIVRNVTISVTSENENKPLSQLWRYIKGIWSSQCPYRKPMMNRLWV